MPPKKPLVIVTRRRCASRRIIVGDCRKPRVPGLVGHRVERDDGACYIIGDAIELIMKERERPQVRGRLDFLLQDSDLTQRYEVELQLGSTDPSHIIRTLEYWDVERKRYQRIDHTAVLVAEDITSRFLNVISLFNGHIPLVAIQMNAVQIGQRKYSCYIFLLIWFIICY